jgi:hypothetical protein
MSVRPGISGSEGELVSVRATVDARHLEHLLDCLAQVNFPINPRIVHGRSTTVIFPAFDQRLPELRDALWNSGFDPESLAIHPILDDIAVS